MPAIFEELHAYIAAQLAEPVEQQFAEDGPVVLTSGDPGEVVVRLTNTTVTVAEYAVRWDGPQRSVEPVAIGMLKWRRMSAESAMHAVKSLIAAARDARLSKYRTCRICEERKPPEWMFDDEVCQDCAESELGVVH